jgi:6-phosphogluconate dehydrogenase
MENKNLRHQYEIGMVGPGVMGRNLLLNMADNGFSVAGYDNDQAKVEALKKEIEKKDIHCSGNLLDFISNLRLPHAVILLVPAGVPVDSVIGEMSVHLKRDDLIIDSGNSYFKDTNLRTIRLKEKGILFMGMGISGGEEGARHGASIMPGGLKKAYERVRPVLEAVAARVNGAPCVTYLGPSSAGHFVKMVHNGIEYGLMQLISETYALMKLVLGYLDAYRSSWLPANLIQAQRDYFGAHTYERIDAKGTYHTEWLKGLK